MVKLKDSIPAVLVHCEGNKEYRVRGNIVGINESAGTVSMKFKGYNKVEHGIPMDSIYLSEGIIDQLKGVAGKIRQGINTLVRKIKGFLFPVDENGNIDRDVMGVGVNLAAKQAKGGIADGVTFYPSNTVLEYANEQGTACEAPDYDIADSIAERDAASIEKYWGRVMREYVKNESYSAADAVRSVNEKYYNIKKSKALNEAVWSLENQPNNREAYGVEMDLELCIQEVRANIMEQLTRDPDDPMPVPLIIWGAPGIGKTTIIRNMIDMIKEEDGLDLMYLEVSCANLNYEDWGLPTTAQRNIGTNIRTNVNSDEIYATSAPQHWLPVYEASGTPAEIRAKDEYYNSGRFYHGDASTKTYNGGILFFDELTQLPLNAAKIMQALAGQRAYMGKTLASKWALVYASNRFEDIDADTNVETFYWDEAQKGRYTSITYVPRLEDWLDWARSINKKSGRANIDKMFTDFISQGGKKLWYDALVFLEGEEAGSRDTQLSKEQLDTIEGMKNNSTPFDFNTIRDEILHDPKLRSGGSAGIWNGREWSAKINGALFKWLKNIVFPRHPELYDSIFVDGSIDRAALKQALYMLSPKEWARVSTRQLDPTGGKLDRLTVIDNKIKMILASQTGSQSIVSKDWDVFVSYRRIFTDDTCRCIWETGKLPQAYQADDDKWYRSPTDYINSEDSRWKSMTPTVMEVIRTVMNVGTSADMIDMIHEELHSAPKAPKAGANLVDKWAKNGTIKTKYTSGKNKEIPLLFTPAEMNTPEAQAIASTLENSQVAKMFFNVAMWCAKIAIQSGSQAAAVGVEITKFFDPGNSKLVKAVIAKYPEDKELLTNLSAIRAGYEKQAAGQKGSQVNDKLMKAEIHKGFSDRITYGAFIVGSHLSNIDNRIVRTGDF